MQEPVTMTGLLSLELTFLKRSSPLSLNGWFCYELCVHYDPPSLPLPASLSYCLSSPPSLSLLLSLTTSLPLPPSPCFSLLLPLFPSLPPHDPQMDLCDLTTNKNN